MSNEDMKHRAGFLIFIVLAIPILYGLLLGPAVLLHRRREASSRDPHVGEILQKLFREHQHVIGADALKEHGLG